MATWRIPGMGEPGGLPSMGSHRVGHDWSNLAAAAAAANSILKSRDITLPTKVCIVKALVFPVVIYGCERWTIKKAKRQKIDAFEFELSCLRRLLRVPWTARDWFPKGNQSRIHWKDLGWSWNFNTLAMWCEESTHWKRPWCWQRLKAGGEGDDRGWDGWMASPTGWTWVWGGYRSWWWTGKPGV